MKIFSKFETNTHKTYKVFGIKFKVRKVYNNKIFVIDKNGNKKRVFGIRGLKIKFCGANSEVIIHKPILKFENSKIVCGNNEKVEIMGSKAFAKELQIFMLGDNNECFIGSDFLCTKSCIIQMNKEQNLKVKIGNDCMFGSFIIIRVTDSHTIVNKDTKQVINYGKDVEIGNRVWLSRDVVVMKGVEIADNCVVGACSVVTKSLTEENAIYAGSPAKKIKSNIEWFRSSIPKYEEAIRNGEMPI